MHHAVWAPLTAFTASLVTVWWLTRSRLARLALDRPNERSLHETPVPRMGGIGIHVGAVLAWLTLGESFSWLFWIPYCMLIAVSFVDDVRRVSITLRLAVHLLGAGLLVFGTLYPEIGIAWTLAAFVTVAWMANLYNFMDGSDGLAGGMALIGFAFYAIAAAMAGSASFAIVNLSVAAGAAAFLIFNFHPARIFMGDVGAVPLGFLAAAFGVSGWLRGDWAPWFPVLVFSPFIVDASATLARRIARREPVWEAHRDHYYQRMVQMGWGHRATAWAEYALMLACGLAALAALIQPPEATMGILGAAVFGYGLIIAAIERAWRRHLAERTP